MVGKLHCLNLTSSLKVKHLGDDRSRSYRIIIIDSKPKGMQSLPSQGQDMLDY